MQKKMINEWITLKSTDKTIHDGNHVDKQLQLSVTLVTRKSTITTAVGWSMQK